MEMTKNRAILGSVQPHDFVSCRMTATVAMHGMKSIVTTRNESADAVENVEVNVCASPAVGLLPKSTPRVATAFSFAGKLVISATVKRQSIPIQRPIGSTHFPNCTR